MHQSSIATTACLTAALCLACAGTGPREVAGPPPDRPEQAGGEALDEQPAPAPEEANPAVAAALEAALVPGAEWRDLTIEVECLGDAGFERVQVFGSGTAIWNRERQFRLERIEVAELLAVLQRAEFAAMREVYGGREDPLTPKPEPDAGSALRVVCRVALTLDGVSKQSSQLDRGRQSEELRGLAHEILDHCREPAASGIGADDLADGLTKVADEILAPEALTLLLHRKPEARQMSTEGGFLMRFVGRNVSVRPYAPGSGYGAPRQVELSPAELAEVTRLLVEVGIEELPVNLWAEQYTDFVVEVLNRSKRLQARQFAGKTRDTHGAQQADFDRVYATLVAIADRVLATGEPGA